MPRRCDECGSSMRPPARETVPYRCGIPNVFLVDVDVHRCTECDNYSVDVPHVEKMHKVLALQVAQQDDLTPEEIRFLRKFLGWAQKDMAAEFQVDPATVSRWEHGHQNMSKPLQMLLKLYVQHGPIKNDYSEDVHRHRASRRLELVPSPMESEEPWRFAAAN